MSSSGAPRFVWAASLEAFQNLWNWVFDIEAQCRDDREVMDADREETKKRLDTIEKTQKDIIRRLEDLEGSRRRPGQLNAEVGGTMDET